MTKPVYFGLPILQISNIVIYGFWFDYAKSNSGENAKLCDMDTDSFKFHIKTENIFIKVGLSPSKKNILFASMIALQKWWKMLFIYLKGSFHSQDI